MANAPSLWNGGRFNNLPGMNRDNAPSKPVDSSLIARMAAGARNWLGLNTDPTGGELPFFPPGKPMDPVAVSAEGRRFDYPTNYNTTVRPRSYEPIDFETLRALAEPSVGGWDLIRLAVETRKDQMSKLTYSILPRKPANVQVRPKSDKRCEQVESFLKRPDGQHSWADWVRMLVEEHLVIDAATIYRRQTVGGDVARLELLDGASIKPLLGYDGRRPSHGNPAYQQVFKGLPAVNYTSDELIYAPRNPRVHRVYGLSPVEQVVVTVNVGLRRQASQLGFFTEGSVPDAVAAVPADWTQQKIQEFQDYWDSIVNDAVKRRKLKFIPGGVEFQRTRNDNALVDQFDEWLARIVQYCFSLPPTPLVKAVNRATAESAYDTALDEGLSPLMMWVKNIIDDVITRWLGYPDLEMVWDDIKKPDPKEKEERDLVLTQAGIISRDDMRADRGLEPLGVPPVVTGIGPLGFMSVSAMVKAIQNGWDLTGMPQPAAPGLPAPGVEGLDPSLAGNDGQDPLAGLPPEVLEALGVSPSHAPPALAAPPESTPATDPANDPGGSTVVPFQRPQAPPPKPGHVGRHDEAETTGPVPIHRHPAVLHALRAGEAHAQRASARHAPPGAA